MNLETDIWKRKIHGMCLWISIGLFIWSVFCTILCFGTSRQYCLFAREEEHPPPSTSARRRVLNKEGVSGTLRSLIDRFRLVNSKEEKKGSNISEEVWELRVWNPSTLLIRFFCFFNPINLILLWTNPLSPKNILLATGISIQLYLFHRIYANYVIDKSIIHSEVFHEYSKKFVEPRLFPYKRDVATSTHPELVHIEAHTPQEKPNKIMHQPSVSTSNRIRSLIEEEWHTPCQKSHGGFKGFPITPSKKVQPSPAKGFRPANSWSIGTSGNHLSYTNIKTTKHQ
ncbi:hypothetical protein T552_01917 [Pneumocystis carinii B80]|uniref:Nuclear rim protein 1 n=1 Tax=Pneumocystis carinii (strain B80) TaxID=1408658 RepID=A0A0W4ZI50_PNEC8|nr:hypothetical protein T552_01917 [Pneumocystis carinii B80]KTW28055.1 hypothetical protein T552_01917 [Pneumocystis carinii B80]